MLLCCSTRAAPEHEVGFPLSSEIPLVAVNMCFQLNRKSRFKRDLSQVKFAQDSTTQAAGALKIQV